MGVLWIRIFVILPPGIFDTIHLLPAIKDTVFNFFGLLSGYGYWIFRKINYGVICQFIRDTCLYT